MAYRQGLPSVLSFFCLPAQREGILLLIQWWFLVNKDSLPRRAHWGKTEHPLVLQFQVFLMQEFKEEERKTEKLDQRKEGCLIRGATSLMLGGGPVIT